MKKVLLLGLAAAGLFSLQTAFAFNCNDWVDVSGARISVVQPGQNLCIAVKGTQKPQEMKCTVLNVTRTTNITVYYHNLRPQTRDVQLTKQKVEKVVSGIIRPNANGTIEIVNHGYGQFGLACNAERAQS